MRVKINDAYVKTILLSPLTTLFQSKIEILNKGMLALLLFFLFMMMSRKKFKKSIVIVMLLALMCQVWATFSTVFPIYSLNTWFYFPVFILYFLYFAENKDEMMELLASNGSFIQWNIRIWCLLVAFSAFLPSSYPINTDWGGGAYFASFTDNSFRLGPAALFMLTLIFFSIIVLGRRKNIIWSLVPLFCFYKGGSRIYFGIGLILFMVVWYFYFFDKKKFWLSLIPLGTVFVALFFSSNIYDKFVATSYTANSYFDYWGTVTNSRSIFWVYDMEAYFSQDFLHKLFGLGFNFVYEVNKATVGVKIWAHNDFIQIVTTYGLLGLILYFYVFIHSFNLLYPNKKERRGFVNTGIWICVVMIWFLNAFFNMFYTYFCSVLCFPILALVVKAAYEQRRVNRNAEFWINDVQIGGEQCDG